MKQLITRIALLAVVLLATLASSAAVKIDGIYYNLNAKDYTAEVTNCLGGSSQCPDMYSNPDYMGNVEIPKTVTYQGVTYRVTSIGKWAFLFCKEMTSITFPETIVVIGEYSFGNCYGLTSVVLPPSLHTLGSAAFEGCRNIAQVVFPNSLTSIGTGAFRLCQAIVSISLPRDLTSIGKGAFMGCSISSVTFPESLTSIGKEAFDGCPIETVSFSESLTSIGEYAFRKCPISALNLPESLLSIGSRAFQGAMITEVTIPSATLEFDPAFADCKKLEKINVASANVNYKSIDGIVYTKDLSMLVEAPGAYDKPLVVPNSVKTVGDDAFYACSNLPSVKFNGGVSSIGEDAFNSCDNLSSVTFSEGLLSIAWGAFMDCSSLSSLIFPESLTTIGAESFLGCSGLQIITFPKSLSRIGDLAFYGCNALQKIYCKMPRPIIGERLFDIDAYDAFLYVPKGTSNEYRITSPWKNFSHIEEFDFDAAFDDISFESIKSCDIMIDGNAMRIDGAVGQRVAVYGVDGRCEWRTANYDGSAVELAPGVHIVRVGDHSTKVML